MIQNPKSLLYVTWVPPNVKKNVKNYLSCSGVETWILNVLKQY